MEDPRMVVKCLTCNLVQYQTKNQRCRRCLHSIEVKKFELPVPTKFESPRSENTFSEVLFRPIPTSDMPKMFGSQLKSWRECRGMTQATFVAKARKLYGSNLSRSYLSRVETSQMVFSIGHIFTTLKCLEVSPKDFFSGYEKDWFIEGVVVEVSKVPISNRPLILKAIKSLTLRSGYEHQEEAQDIATTYGVNVPRRKPGRRLFHGRDAWAETRIGA